MRIIKPYIFLLHIYVMDELNRKILLMLLKNYNSSQRSIAKKLGISPPAVNYRIDKLLSDGAIKKISLYVNPNFYGKYHGYVAFRNYNNWNGEYIAKIECLERTTIYEIESNNIENLKSKIDYMAENLGAPEMVYIPDQYPYNPSNFDIKLVSIMKDNPYIETTEIAEKMKVSSKTVRRHIRYLVNKNFMRFIPIVDLNKAEISIFAIFTKNVEIARKLFSEINFREISDSKAGIFINIANDMEEIKKYTDKMREFDKDAELMITYSYDFS
jgi:DNA-binding Lrp family transcriptional regulator